MEEIVIVDEQNNDFNYQSFLANTMFLNSQTEFDNSKENIRRISKNSGPTNWIDLENLENQLKDYNENTIYFQEQNNDEHKKVNQLRNSQFFGSGGSQIFIQDNSQDNLRNYELDYIQDILDGIEDF